MSDVPIWKIFINQDNKYLTEIAKGIEPVTYGSDETAFAWGCVVGNNPYLTFEWKQQGKIHTVETRLIGSYNLDNALAAVAVGRLRTDQQPFTTEKDGEQRTDHRRLQRKSEQHESRLR